MSEPYCDQSIFYQAFMRDNQSCVYCGKNMMESFDTFAQMQEDHLKPSKTGGDYVIENIVTSCFVCNNLKRAYDPFPEVDLDKGNRDSFLKKAKEFVAKKRTGEIDNSYYRDYNYWKDILEI